MLKNGLINTVGNIVRIAIRITTVPILIRFLGISEYGLWVLASSSLVLVSLAEGGLTISTAVFVARGISRADDFSALSKTLTIIGCLTLTLASLAAFTLWVSADFTPNMFGSLLPEQKVSMTKILKLAGFAIWPSITMISFIGIQQAYQRYDRLNAINSLGALIFFVGLSTIAYSGGRAEAMMTWQAAVNLALLATHAWSSFDLMKKINLYFIFDISSLYTIGKFSLMTWISSIGGKLFTQGDRLIIAGLLGTKELGIYAAITSIATQINVFSALPIQPIVPKIASILESNLKQKKIFFYIIKRSFIYNFLAAIFIGSLLFFGGEEVVKIFIGNSSPKIIEAYHMAIVIYTVLSVNAVGYYILLAINEVKSCMYIQLTSGLFAIILIYVGASFYGLNGAVLGNIGYLGILAMNLLAVKKINALLAD